MSCSISLKRILLAILGLAIKLKSLNELTDIADSLIQKLENKKNLEESIEDYQYLIKLNKITEQDI